MCVKLEGRMLKSLDTSSGSVGIFSSSLRLFQSFYNERVLFFISRKEHPKQL